MAEYKGIKGFKVESLASDPSLVEGQVWYNTAGYALKYQSVAATWASGGALGTALYGAGAGGGTLTAGITMSGKTGPGPTTLITPKTQLYNGTAWSDGNDINLPRTQAGGSGDQTAAVIAGGTTNETPTEVGASETYDGTSWTTGNSLNRSTCRAMGAAGVQTAAFVVGGMTGIPTTGATESFDGTSWTETGANLNTIRAHMGCGGTLTAGVAFGGITPGPSVTENTVVTEEWDGSAWANSNDMNTERREMGSCGTQTAAFGFGGIGPPSNQKKAVSETYDGTSWTNGVDMATARYSPTPSKFGSTTSAYAAGGNSASPPFAITEEFGPAAIVKTVTVS